MHPQPQRKRTSVTPGVLITIVAVILASPFVIWAFFGLMAAGADTPPAGGHHVGHSATASPGDTPSDSPSDTFTPAKSDFELKAKTLDKECFGNAGCNITYRIKVTYNGRPLSAEHQYEVTYKILGASDGAQVGTVTVTGDQYETNGEEMAETPSSATKLTVKVTDVEQVS